jgi:lysozyme
MNARGNENLEYFNNPFVRAFAFMVMKAEGTTKHGYYTLFGNTPINSLSAHPNTVIKAGGYHSSAAGAFQFLSKTWTGLAQKLGLTDFSENSQNAAFVELLREKNALIPLLNGDFDTALNLSRRVWASLPGAGYGQGEKSLNQVRAWFQEGLNNPAYINQNSGSQIPVAALAIGALLLFLILE